MKAKLIIVAMIFITGVVSAQTGFNYKAIVKDAGGDVVANDLIAVQFTILDGATAVYRETHTPTTDDMGMMIVNIGEGTPTGGSNFAGIDWGSQNHFLNVQFNMGAGLVDLGTTGFQSVPYAKIAQEVENTLWEVNGSNISYSDGNIGLGIPNPSHPFHIVNSINGSSVNTVSIEATATASGRDLVELKLPANAPDNAQFMEMQRGNTVVAQINGDGSARFESIRFGDNTVQTSAPVGPLAFGFISANGTIASGSGNFTSTWDPVLNRYEIDITGENYFFSDYTSIVTPTSDSIYRFRVSSSGGVMLVYLYDAADNGIQGQYQFLTFKN